MSHPPPTSKKKLIDYSPLFDSILKYEENENIIELDKFFPFPFSTSAEDEDENLLFIDVSVNFTSCDKIHLYQLNKNPFSEMEYNVENYKSSISLKEDNENPFFKIFKWNDFEFVYVDVIFFISNRNLKNDSLIKQYFSVENVSNTVNGHLPINQKTIELIRLSKIPLCLLEGDKDISLKDTFDFPESQVSKDFRLKLRDYQLRSLSWMKAIESEKDCYENSLTTKFNFDDMYQKIKIGNSGYYFDIHNWIVTKSPTTIKLHNHRINFGILADDTGSGKTITCLALIASSPFDEAKMKMRNEKYTTNFPFIIPSKASLILCPPNVHQQWISEALRCSPKQTIIAIKCKTDHDKISWYDIMHADIVIVPYDYLSNANYLKTVRKCFSPFAEFKEYLHETGRVNLEHVLFYRIFYDEFHELEYMSSANKCKAKNIKADFKWGMTGTPNFKTNRHIIDLIEFFKFGDKVIGNLFWYAQREFRSKFIKRNEPNLNLPKLETEIVWVTQTVEEKVFMDMMADCEDTKTQIMMCCHYQIIDRVSKVVGSTFLSLKEVRSSLLRDAIITLSCDEQYLVGEMKKLELFNSKLTEFSSKDSTERNYVLNQISLTERGIKSLSTTVEQNKKNIQYFKEVFDVLENSSKKICAICRDEIKDFNLSILKCGHFYCYDCICRSFTSVGSKCPYCFYNFKDKGEILRLKMAKKEILTENTSENEVVSNHGSKLVSLYRYIQKVIEENDTNRIIIFLQYKNLSDFISETLKKLSIPHVRVAGNIFQRTKSIEAFKTSKDFRIVLMSSEDNVSGINMTEATHIILLHPFWTGRGEDVDMSFEKQGISRAYRSGLDHPLKIVRFAVRNSIDEVLTRKRCGI